SHDWLEPQDVAILVPRGGAAQLQVAGGQLQVFAAAHDHLDAPTVSRSPPQPQAEPKGKGKSVLDAPQGVLLLEIQILRWLTSAVSVMICTTCLSKRVKNTEERSNDQEYTNNAEGKPSDHAVKQQPKSHVGEIGSSIKLRSREKLQKVGISQHTAEDYFDEDFVELSASEQDNESSVDYTAGSKRKIRQMSRDGAEEPQQQGIQNDESKVPSWGRKKTSKDAPTEKSEKKLTHRIRQKIMKEVKTLLEKPYAEIDHKKLSAAHLRLLQEARERINGKEILSGPSLNARQLLNPIVQAARDAGQRLAQPLLGLLLPRPALARRRRRPPLQASQGAPSTMPAPIGQRKATSASDAGPPAPLTARAPADERPSIRARRSEGDAVHRPLAWTSPSLGRDSGLRIGAVGLRWTRVILSLRISWNCSSQHENPDDFEYDRYDEDRTETNENVSTCLFLLVTLHFVFFLLILVQGLRQFGIDFAMIQQLFPDKTRHHVRRKFRTEEKNNPMLIQHAVIHRCGDNLYFKKVIKQLNIDDVLPDISSTRKQDGASNEGGPSNENALDDFINEEENSPNRMDKEQYMPISDVEEEDHVPGNTDDLGDIFDWCGTDRSLKPVKDMVPGIHVLCADKSEMESIFSKAAKSVMAPSALSLPPRSGPLLTPAAALAAAQFTLAGFDAAH
ncbi:hypothetical protein EJB05_44366, partial [Eragrostis curvula]